MFLDNGQPAQHGKIMHVGWTVACHTRTYRQCMMGIGGPLYKPFEICRPSPGADFAGIHLLEAEHVSLETFELGAKHCGALFESSTSLPCTAEIFKIETCNPHVDQPSRRSPSIA